MINTYFDKYLAYVRKIANNSSLTQKEKEKLINDAKNEFSAVANFADIVLDAKLGTRKYESQDEYNKEINSAIQSAKKLNGIYKEQMGEDLIVPLPNTASQMFKLSSTIDDEILEDAEADWQTM